MAEAGRNSSAVDWCTMRQHVQAASPTATTTSARTSRNQNRRVISYAESLAIQYLPDFFRGNGAFAHNSPTVLSAQIHNRGGNITRRGAAVNDDANAAIELQAHLFGGCTLRRAAEVCRRCSNWNTRGSDDRQRNLGRRHAERHV